MTDQNISDADFMDYAYDSEEFKELVDSLKKGTFQAVKNDIKKALIKEIDELALYPSFIESADEKHFIMNMIRREIKQEGFFVLNLPHDKHSPLSICNVEFRVFDGAIKISEDLQSLFLPERTWESTTRESTEALSDELELITEELRLRLNK